MSGSEFENLMARILWEYGGRRWTLVIPRNRSGAQPFDLIAIGKNSIYAADCKVCGQPRFPVSRIEDNQWLAMEQLRNIRDDATICFFCYYDGDVYIIPYSEAKYAVAHGEKSIRLSPYQKKQTNRAEAFLFLGKEEVEKYLNEGV